MTHPLVGLFLIVLIGSSSYALGRVSGRRDRLDAYRCGRQDGTEEEWNRQRAYVQATLRQAVSNRVTVAFHRSAASAPDRTRGDSYFGTTYRSSAAVMDALVPAPRAAGEWLDTAGLGAPAEHAGQPPGSVAGDAAAGSGTTGGTNGATVARPADLGDVTRMERLVIGELEEAKELTREG